MQVTEHIHAIKIPFKLAVGPGVTVERFVYAYLVYGTNITLVDTGVAGSEGVLFDYVRGTGRAPEEISAVIQTHSHPDHIGATRAVKDATGCTVAAHAAERSWIEDVDLQFKERPVPSFHTIVGGSTPVDRILEDGERSNMGGVEIEVLHTPGHSAGSISLLIPQDGAFISGDAVPLPNDIPIYDDVVASVSSIQRLQSLENVDVLLASWDDPRTGSEVTRTLDDGLDFLRRIHKAVTRVAGDELDPMQLSARVLAEMGMPEGMVNPLVARSFASNVANLDRIF